MLMTGYSMIEFQELTEKRLKNENTFFSLKHAVEGYKERVQFVKDSSSACYKRSYDSDSDSVASENQPLKELVQSEQADVVWVTETWLTSLVENKEILPSGYVIYRRDRGSHAGGVLLAVKANSFSFCREIADFNDSDLETASVELTTKSKAKRLACCCYRTPTPERDWWDKFNIHLAKCSSRYRNMLIAGDFNFSEVHWESPEITKGVDEGAFVEQLSKFFLTQLNTIPTRGDNFLDLVITSVASQVNDISVLSPKESGLFTDHGTIVFHLKISRKAAPPIARTVYDYCRGDFNGLRSAIGAIDLLTDDVNISWHQWKDAFLAAVRDYIPTKNIKGRNNPPWINGDIVHALRKKESARQKFLSSPTDSLRAKFRELRAKVKNMIKESRTNFFNSLDSDLRNNPKRFWSVFKLSSKESTFSDTMSMGVGEGVSTPSHTASSLADIASMFNEYFTSVFSTKDHPDPTPTETEPSDHAL
ncbi:uncharacterized protein [Montipora capricornis]|uniref:uncharacterized protein n=1 Tax=Montipora capricornis TaxID=246305 RepID=UPI0035F21745